MALSKIALGCLMSTLLTGCATASFAPPRVQLGYAISRPGADKCDFSDVAHKKDGSNKKIHRNATGALKLVNNFILTYRCSARKAADGRQFFEVPSFLAAAGGVTAAALGAGRSVAIATGAGASIFGGAKNYYAPKDKVHILNSALDALICIKSESVGITAFSDDAEQGGVLSKKIGNNNSENFGSDVVAGEIEDDDSVFFPAERRYFEMIAASLFSVERILAERLSSVGKLDPAGFVAEIESLTQKLTDAKAAKEAEQLDAQGSATDDAGAASVDAQFAMTANKNSASSQALSAIVEHNTKLKLNVMQPKLQRCVVRAKL